MLANIDKAEVLDNKAQELANQAKTFHRTARATKNHMCMQNMKMNILIACICLIVILAVVLPIVINMAPAAAAGGGGSGPAPVSPVASSPPPAQTRL